MARWGEGDPRWIVEERSDATNVNNWHWVEKNATPWSRERLTNLLLKQTIKGEEASAFNIVFTEFKKLEGEASANNRKAKLIFFFEWNIVIEFKATVAGSNVEYKGTVEVLNLSDENEADEIEISAQVDNPGPEANKIREILNKQGLQLVRTQLGKYIHELKKEFSQGLILPTDKSGAIGPQATVGKGKTVLVDKRGFQNDVIMSESNKKAADGTTTKTNTGKPEVGTTGGFELSETFKVPPERLYEILTEPELVAAWSPNSNVDPREGGTFSLLGGIIGGAFTKLVKDNQIAMKWRLKSYPPGHHANVQLMLCDQGDCVDLKLKADCVPEKAMEETKTGFSKYYFLAIGRKFGISLNMF